MVARFMPTKVKAKVVLNANKPVRLWRHNENWPSLDALNATEINIQTKLFTVSPSKKPLIK